LEPNPDDVRQLVTGANIDDVGAIVFDEGPLHGDAERGTAWEESICWRRAMCRWCACPPRCPNAAEIAEWIRDAHGDLTCIFHDQRAVPLEHRYWLPASGKDPEEHGFNVYMVVGPDGHLTADARKLRNVGGDWRAACVGGVTVRASVAKSACLPPIKTRANCPRRGGSSAIWKAKA